MSNFDERPLVHKDFLALKQVVMAMVLKAERQSPGYIDEIRGISNMAHASVEVDEATWELFGQFKTQVDRL